MRRSETHLILVFGSRNALAVGGGFSCWNHSYLLYWHAAVSKQPSCATPAAFSVFRTLLSSNLCPCVGSAVPSTDKWTTAARFHLFIGSIRITNSKGMGSGHRRNRMTAHKMVGCEVVMETRRKLLNSARCFLLFLLPPPHRQEEELRCVSSKQGSKGEKKQW